MERTEILKFLNSPRFDCSIVYPRANSMSKDMSIMLDIIEVISDKTSKDFKPTPSYE